MVLKDRNCSQREISQIRVPTQVEEEEPLGSSPHDASRARATSRNRPCRPVPLLVQIRNPTVRRVGLVGPNGKRGGPVAADKSAGAEKRACGA